MWKGEGAVRNWLRQYVPCLKWSDADIVELLAKSKRKLKADAKGGKGLRYNRDQDDKPLTLEDMIKFVEGAEKVYFQIHPCR